MALPDVLGLWLQRSSPVVLSWYPSQSFFGTGGAAETQRQPDASRNHFTRRIVIVSNYVFDEAKQP
jgi:hypothetical protein